VPVVTIEGIEVSVEHGATILDAARLARVWIPAMCHLPSISEQGSCRLCMVAIERRGRKEIVTACNYPIRGDLAVSVADEKATRVRRGVMELLLARSPESPELREVAERMGISGTRFPTVTESQRNCILCGLCVAVCEEAITASAIGFAGRGVERTVASPFRQPSETCIACGACAAVCPVGTIQVRLHADTGEAEISPFKSRVKLATCAECGKRTVSPSVAAATAAKVSMEWEQFKALARLCPECRRKHAAESLALVASRSGAPESRWKES